MADLSGDKLFKAEGAKPVNRLKIFVDKITGKWQGPNASKFFIIKGTEDYVEVTLTASKADLVTLNAAVKKIDEKIKSATAKKAVKDIILAEEKALRTQVNKIKFTGKPTNESYTLKQISNNVEFGGKLPGESAGRRAERRVYQSLQGTDGKKGGQIRTIMKATGKPFVPVVIPGINTVRNPYEVVECVWMDNPSTIAELNESGTLPKADFRFVDRNGKSVVFFSYKDNSNVRENDDGTWSTGKPDAGAFQQYSGITEKVPAVYGHPEVQNFIKYCQHVSRKTKRGKEYYEWPSNLKLAVKIDDNELKKKAMFGLSAGSKQFSVDNCQLVMQGRVQFRKLQTAKKEYPDIFEFSPTNKSHMVINNGTIPPEFNDSNDYCPMFCQRTENGRGVFGIPKIRLGIYPRKKAGGGYTILTSTDIKAALKAAGIQISK